MVAIFSGGLQLLTDHVHLALLLNDVRLGGRETLPKLRQLRRLKIACDRCVGMRAANYSNGHLEAIE